MADVCPERRDASRGGMPSSTQSSTPGVGACTPARAGVKTQLKMSDGFAAQAAMLTPRENRSAAPVQREAAAPNTGALEAEKAAMADKLFAFDREVADHLAAHAAWLSSNWTLFIASTNGNPSVAISEQDFVAAAGGANNHVTVGEVLDEDARGKLIGLGAAGVDFAAETFTKGATSGLGSVLGKLALAGVAGHLVGLVWTVVSMLMSSKQNEKARHAQSKAQGDQTKAQLDLFETQRGIAVAKARGDLDQVRIAMRGATSTSELGKVDAWITSQRAALGPMKSPSDNSLCTMLQQHWVLQHSESPGEVDDDASEVAYDDMLANEAVSKPVEKEKLLFVHQLRHMLLDAGLMDHGVVAPLERTARTVLAQTNLAVTIASFEGRRLTFERVMNPAAFARTAAQHHEEKQASSRIPDFEWPAKNGNVRASAVMHLEEDEGSALLSEVGFEAECTGVDREDYERNGCLVGATRPCLGGFDQVRWSSTP